MRIANILSNLLLVLTISQALFRAETLRSRLVLLLPALIPLLKLLLVFVIVRIVRLLVNVLL